MIKTNQLYNLEKKVDETIKLLNSLPGGYQKFRDDYELKNPEGIGVSRPNLNKRKDALRAWIEKSEKRDGIENKSLKDLDVHEFLQLFFQAAEDHEKKMYDLSSINTSWIINYFSMPIAGSKSNPTMGKAWINIENKSKCSLYKKDFEHEPGYTVYYGEYSETFSSLGELIFSAHLESNNGRKLSFIATHLSRNKSGSSTGVLSQFDGNRVFSTRVLCNLLGSEITTKEAFKLFDEFDITIASDYLKAREDNYICAFDINHKKWTRLGSGQYHLESRLRFIDSEVPLILTMSDVGLVLNKTPDEIDSQNLIQTTLNNVKSKCFNEGYMINLLEYRDAPQMISLLKTASFFILTYSGSGDSFETSFVLGKVLSYAKNILFMYKRGSISESTILSLEEQQRDDNLGINLKLLPFDNLSKEQKYLEKDIYYFLRYRQ